MLTQSLLAFGALAFATFSSAKPLPSFKQFLAKRGHGSQHSFNKYSGFETMNNFDDFYGVDNFSGSHATFHHDKDVVCTTGSVEIVQQYLTVLREYYKKIITEQICEVEVQTIVHQQFVSGCEGFSNDIRRNGDCNEVTYDHDISCKIVNIHDESNNCVIKDWGWNGQIVGSHACSYSGDNWDSSSSPESVSSIYGYCQQSYGYSSPSYSSYWQSSYSPSYSYGSSYGGSYDSSYGSSYSPSYTYTQLAPPPSYTYGYSSGYTYDPPSYSYTYEAPSYTYSESYEPPSYTYSDSYDPPSYTSSYEAPSYTSSSYEYGSSYEPSYGSSYGSSYEPSSSYGSSEYGSSEYGSSYGSGSSYEPSYGSGYSSPDVSVPSNVTVCDSCESSDSAPPPVPVSSNSTDDSVPSSSDVTPTDDSVPSSTDVASTSATDASSDSAPAPTDASSSSAIATDSANLAATSVGSAGATIVNTGTAPAPAAASA